MRLTIAEINHFASQYVGEPFNAFAFDCNSDYADVLLSLNTHSHLKKFAHDFAEKWGTVDAEREAKSTGQPVAKVLPMYDQRTMNKSIAGPVETGNTSDFRPGTLNPHWNGFAIPYKTPFWKCRDTPTR